MRLRRNRHQLEWEQGAVFSGLKSVENVEASLSRWKRCCGWTKRAFDMIIAFVGVLVLMPLAAGVAIAIVMEDGFPVFYTQHRVGRGGRVFRLLKFRSMRRDAEAATGPVLAAADDPRVTRVGRFLRATALDELPQLVNILIGQMSFVGPRAERPEFVARFEREIPNYSLRHLVRPGLTGPAQVFGHYETPPEEKLRYDLDYISNWSFVGDLKLLLYSLLLTLRGQWQKREQRFGTGIGA